MHWELNHCVLPLHFAGFAELCAGLRLPLDQNTWFSERLDLAAVPCCGQVAAGHVYYSAQSRAQGGSREGWQLFSFAVPPMSCTGLSYREQEWEHGKEKER